MREPTLYDELALTLFRDSFWDVANNPPHSDTYRLALAFLRLDTYWHRLLGFDSEFIEGILARIEKGEKIDIRPRPIYPYRVRHHQPKGRPDLSSSIELSLQEIKEFVEE